ncbi:hypothetical protein LINPERPRIM_LOCUS32564 [Linum perenne]
MDFGAMSLNPNRCRPPSTTASSTTMVQSTQTRY